MPVTMKLQLTVLTHRSSRVIAYRCWSRMSLAFACSLPTSSCAVPQGYSHCLTDSEPTRRNTIGHRLFFTQASERTCCNQALAQNLRTSNHTPHTKATHLPTQHPSQRKQNRAKEQRKKKGSSSSTLSVCSFVTYSMCSLS